LSLKYRLIWHILFNAGYFTFLWGAFEFAYTLGSPIWSGTFEGLPIPHHYLIGAFIVYVGYILLSIQDLITLSNKVNVK